jgi:2-iminobutanoate/2-iminopropanoate deaminase
MTRIIVSTDQAPAAVGPYSQGVLAGGFLHTAGQIGLDPAVGKLVAGGVVEEARQALLNLGAVVDAAGLSLAGAVKATVYLADMADFAAVNEVYGGFFTVDPPARAAVAVSALPLGAQVMIDLVVAAE